MGAPGGDMRPSGGVSLTVVKADHPSRELSMREVAEYGFPRKGVPKSVNNWKAENSRNLMRGLRRVGLARALGLPHFYGQLWLRVQRASGEEEDLGLVSMRVVTEAGVAFVVDAFQNLVELETMKYHGLGTGTTAESSAQTALVTELTTGYNPDSTRATGTTIEGAAANIYRTVATNTVDASVAITEHGVFSAAAVGSGVMIDRSVFAAVNLTSGDSLQSTYDLTFNSGG